jgi:hypothetical protein
MKKILLVSILFASVSYAQNNSNANNKKIPVKTFNLSQIMIRLCNISYYTDNKKESSVSIADSIFNEVGWDLVWGPAKLTDLYGVTYSAMYVAKNPNSEEYAVVIRGTNSTSLKSWISEDFQVHKSVKFSKYVCNAPSEARISKGTCIGIHDLIKLKDPLNSSSVVNFLKTKQIKSLYVTGHSLGGTLTPAFYTYLCYKLFNGPAPADIDSSPFSFAGLTAGNQEFNDLLATYIQKGKEKWRYVNPLDVAPKLWEYSNLEVLKSIFIDDKKHEKHNSIAYGNPESDFLGYLFDRAKQNNYMQPPNSEFTLDYNFDNCQTIWILEALSQHHSTTYISLVDKAATSQKK